MEPMEKKDQRTPNQGEGAVPSSPRKKRILLCCLAAAVLVIGYTALCAGAGRETIYPNVTVNGVNLGGLTQEAAQTALEEAGGPGRPAGDAENQGVVFTAQTVEGESKTYQVPLASVTPDSVASTQRAWQVGHADPFPLRGGIYLRCLLSGEEVLPAYQGGESLDSILDQVEADLARDPVEPTWETDDTTLHLTRGTPGSRLDREALQGQILDTLGRSDMVELTAEAQPQFTVTLQQTLPGELDLADILSQVETPVQNAAFDKAAKIFQTDHPGISFDAAAAQTAYDGLDWGATQDFPLDITQPTTTVDDLTPKLYQDVLGSCSTNISGSTNRVENIRLAARYFNGTVLMPGETFSYNGIVGSRSAARGFLPAPAYVGGRDRPGDRRRGVPRLLHRVSGRPAGQPEDRGAVPPRVHYPLRSRRDGRYGVLRRQGLPLPERHPLPLKGGGLGLRPDPDGEYPGHQERQHHRGDDQPSCGHHPLQNRLPGG